MHLAQGAHLITWCSPRHGAHLATSISPNNMRMMRTTWGWGELDDKINFAFHHLAYLHLAIHYNFTSNVCSSTQVAQAIAEVLYRDHEQF